MIHRGLKLWFGLICLTVEWGIVWRHSKILLDSGAEDRFGFPGTVGMR